MCVGLGQVRTDQMSVKTRRCSLPESRLAVQCLEVELHKEKKSGVIGPNATFVIVVDQNRVCVRFPVFADHDDEGEWRDAVLWQLNTAEMQWVPAERNPILTHIPLYLTFVPRECVSGLGTNFEKTNLV